MIQSMRSGTMVRPSETLGCVGCHENRLTGAPVVPMPAAMQRPPDAIEPCYGPPRDFNYLTEVQPVFDTHCVRCHDYGEEAGETLNLAGDPGLVFNTSYIELRRKSAVRWFPDESPGDKVLVKAVDDGPPEILPAYSWGSHRSRLVDVIREEHEGVTLEKEGLDRIVTWIDMNAPYYGSYASVYPHNPFGRSPLTGGELAHLRELTGKPVGEQKLEMDGSQVSFARPALSPCLDVFKSTDAPGYREALAIIETGKARLAERPRMDMPGASLIAEERKKLDKYERAVREERLATRALLAGKKYYRPSEPPDTR
jgi:hypothetical protein